jgi:hypothetical protein
MIKIMHAIKRRLARHQQLLNQYKDPDTIFIYQMGKVGSTSLTLGINNTLHVHAFYLKNHTCPARLQGLAKFGLLHIVYRAEQEVMAYLVRRAFRQRKHSKIITLVREPVARNMSMFFHDLDAYLFAAHTNCMNTRDKALPTRFQDMDLLNKVFEQEFDHYYPLNWFDNEFARMTGLNIYDYDFNRDLGYCLIKKPSVEVFCLRTDKIAERMDDLSEFCGSKVNLTAVNRADDKWYHEVYKQFSREYSYSTDELDKIYNSQFFQHFFQKK